MVHTKHGKTEYEWKNREEVIGDVFCTLRIAREIAHCDSKTLHGLVEASRMSAREFVETAGEENEI